MITTRLVGGLGNQLFHYAVGRYLAEKNNTRLLLDTSSFGKYKLHDFSLDKFNIDAEIVNHPRGKIYNEPHFHYYPFTKDQKDNTHLKGYWQTEKYFKDIQDIIWKEVTLKEEFDDYNNRILYKISNSNEGGVSIHIRRADYTKPINQKVHGLLPIEYYKKALETIYVMFKDPDFFIFSDDIAWCKSTLGSLLGEKVTFVENGPDKNHYDLMLMSLCSCHIIANSSFSWWGAWLDKKPDKIVIAPEKWFNISPHNTKDLIPNDWIKI